MKNLFIESDLKEASHEANLLVTQADETVMEAFKTLLLSTKEFTEKVQDAIQKYEKAKAILQESSALMRLYPEVDGSFQELEHEGWQARRLHSRFGA